MDKPWTSDIPDASYVFSVDYAKQLSNAVNNLNAFFLEKINKQAADESVPRGMASHKMMLIAGEWHDAVATTCRDMMAHMNDVVGAYQKMAMDAVSAAPMRIVLDKKPAGVKVGDGL